MIVIAWIFSVWVAIAWVMGIHAYVQVENERDRLCKEMNCCYDNNFDALNCRDFMKQVSGL